MILFLQKWTPGLAIQEAKTPNAQAKSFTKQALAKPKLQCLILTRRFFVAICVLILPWVLYCLPFHKLCRSLAVLLTRH